MHAILLLLLHSVTLHHVTPKARGQAAVRMVQASTRPWVGGTMHAALVFVMATAMPYHPRFETRADAILEAVAGSANPLHEAAALEVIDLHESGLGVGGYPFGLSVAFNPAWNLPDCAREALRRWRRAGRVCEWAQRGCRSQHTCSPHPDLLAYALYHVGACRASDVYAVHEASMASGVELLLGGSLLRAGIASPGVPMLWQWPVRHGRPTRQRVQQART